MAEQGDLKKLERLAARTAELRPSGEVTGATMEAVQLSELERLAATTGALAPADPFLDAVMARVEAASDPLDGFARRTADLRVADGFTDAVMTAVDERRSVFPDGMMRAARPSLLFAAVAAAACFLVSWYTEVDIEEEQVANILEGSE